MLQNRIRYCSLLFIAIVAAVFLLGTFNTAHAQTPSADFRIVDIWSQDGQMVLEVEMFHPDGTFWHFENFIFQGREGLKRPRVTNAQGEALMDNGVPAPWNNPHNPNPITSEEILTENNRMQYLPPGRHWKRSWSFFLDESSILLVIQSVYEERLITNWVDGQSRLIEPPMEGNLLDKFGVTELVNHFTYLKDRGYRQNSNGIPFDYEGEMPEVNPGLGLVEYGSVSTFYPDACPETTSTDGFAQYANAGGGTWSTYRSASGSSAFPCTDSFRVQIHQHASLVDQYREMDRTIVLFDTSALPDDAIISNVDMGLVGITGTQVDDFTDSVAIVTSTPATNTDVVAGDYAQTGTTLQAPTKTIASFTADSSTLSTMTLNATGRGNVSLTGITKFGLRTERDRANNPPAWVSDNISKLNFASADTTLPGDKRPRLVVTYTVPVTAAITGTIGDGATEQEVRDGGGTIVITLTNDTWVAAGGTFDGQRQNIIDGLDAADAQTNGWNAQVRDQLGVSSVIRTSDTVVTITISADDVSDYHIATNEVITTTVPSSAVAGGVAITATPTTTITASAESAVITGTISDGATSTEIKAGGQTAIITLTNTTWVADGSTFNAQRQNIIDAFVSASSDANGWNVRRADLPVTDVVRTSNTVVTVTFSALANYSIGATETITLTVPASAIVYGTTLVATPTFAITPVFVTSGTWISPAINLSSVSELIYCSIGWKQTVPSNTSVTIEYSIDGGSNYTTATNGSCPLTLNSSQASITDFRIKASLGTTDTSVTPSVTSLGFIAGNLSGQTLRYQLNTTPSLTITDRTGNGHSGTMSFPAQPTGLDTTVGSMTAIRDATTAQMNLGVPQMTSPVTGSAVSDNLFNLDETGWAELPGYGIINSMSTAGDGLPIQFVWYIFLGFLIIMGGFFALNLTQSLFAAATTMGVGIGAALAIGGGLMPGWVIFVFIPIAIGLIFLRPRLAI
jgi:hypothetical protein